MKGIHKHQKKIFSLIFKNPYKSYTVRDFQKILKVKSTSTVQHHLNALKKKKMIESHKTVVGRYRTFEVIL